jgi:hypothetical protein
MTKRSGEQAGGSHDPAMNEPRQTPGRWVRQFGYGAALGFVLLWTTAAVVFSDAILIASVVVGVFAFLITVYAFVIRMPDARRVMVVLFVSILFCIGVVGIRFLQQVGAYIKHDVNRSRVAFGFGAYF